VLFLHRKCNATRYVLCNVKCASQARQTVYDIQSKFRPPRFPNMALTAIVYVYPLRWEKRLLHQLLCG
jgi:hypothetical protein